MCTFLGPKKGKDNVQTTFGASEGGIGTPCRRREYPADAPAERGKPRIAQALAKYAADAAAEQMLWQNLC
jgi:hypothetical protein